MGCMVFWCRSCHALLASLCCTLNIDGEEKAPAAEICLWQRGASSLWWWPLRKYQQSTQQGGRGSNTTSRITMTVFTVPLCTMPLTPAFMRWVLVTRSSVDSLLYLKSYPTCLASWIGSFIKCWSGWERVRQPWGFCLVRHCETEDKWWLGLLKGLLVSFEQ